MSGNRVVVHKRNHSPSAVDQLGATIAMAELFAPTETVAVVVHKPKSERPPRLIPVPIAMGDASGDLPQASLAARPIHAVIFDLDEVLIHAAQWRLDALHRPLAMFGFRITPEEQSLARGGFQTTSAILDRLSSQKRFPQALHALVGRIQQVGTTQQIQNRCRPSFEKEYLLMRLKREGYRLAVCSESDSLTVHTILERTGWLDYFEVVVSGEELRTPKPSPELYLSACDRLGLRPNQMVAVEATPRGIESAHRAGIHVCEITGDGLAEWGLVGKFLNQIDSRPTGVRAC